MLWPRITEQESKSLQVQKFDAEHDDTDQNDSSSAADIDSLFRLSRKGLWGLLIFLAASIIALYFREHTLTGTLPADFLEQLGPRPPVLLITIVLGVSTLSSLIIIAGRIYNGCKPSCTWTHLCFRLAFFILYFIADSLNAYFNIVFISSLSVLALQHYNFWNYYLRAIEVRTSIQQAPNALTAGK